MKCVLITNGQNKVYRFMDASGNEIFPDVPTSLVSSEVVVNFPVENARIKGGKVVEVIPEETKAEKLDKEYNKLVNDVKAEMEKVFKTKNENSALAQVLTLEAMVKRPANFIDEELGFSSEADVLSYANAQLALIDSYGIYRLKRLKAFSEVKNNG